MSKSLAEQIALLPEEEREAILEDLDPEQLRWDWDFWARPEQVAPRNDDWSIFLALAGRGFGKTRASAEWVREKARISNQGPLRIGLVARTASDVRDVIVQGEALALDTPVPTPSGWTTMGELSTGDIVISGEGQPTTVVEAFPVLEGRPCYRVTFRDGNTVVSDANHKWLVESFETRAAKHRLKDPSKSKHQPEVLTTEEMFKAGLRHGPGSASECWNWAVHHVPASFGNEDVELPIDPYTLGAWLGDGTSKSADICLAYGEADELRAAIPYEMVEQLSTRVAGCSNWTVKGLSKGLLSLGLKKNKHIPPVYLRASVEQRMELLRGLMDTDGSCSTGGQAEFVSTIPALASGMSELLGSLGIRHKTSIREERPMTGIGVGYAASKSWRIQFSSGSQVFKLSRKLARVNVNGWKPYTHIVAIDPVPSVPVRCIAVSAACRTFKVSKGFISTHNSGILAISPPSERPEYQPSLRKLTWPNGNTALCYTSEEPSTLRGPQFHYAFADEFAAWRQIPDEVGMTAWANLRIATRLGRNPQIFVATTPKRVQSLKDLMKEAGEKSDKIIVRKGTTMDNMSNLAEAYMEGILGVYDGTKLGRQELYGEMLDDIEGALFSMGNIDTFRANMIPVGTPLKVVGVDPTVAERPGDDCGIVVMAATADRDLYKRQAWVLEDATIHGSPEVWAKRAVETARKWGAPIVAERNQGGIMIRNAIQAIDPRIVVHDVWSKQGKALRAEPVALIYEQGRIHHLGYLAELEDQMTTWEPENKKAKSPDRLDALVLAATALMVKPPPGFGGGVLSATTVAKRKIPVSRGTGAARGGGGKRAAIYGVDIKRR